MILHEIDLRNIGCFEAQSFKFHRGVNTVPFDPPGGKTILRSAFVNVLRAADRDAFPYLRIGTSTSTIRLIFSIGSNRVEIEKFWSSGVVTRWMIRFGRKNISMQKTDGQVEWCRWFMKQLGYSVWTATGHETTSGVVRLYNDIVDALLRPGRDFLERCLEGDYRFNVFGLSHENRIAHGISHLYEHCLTTLEEQKIDEQKRLKTDHARQAVEDEIRTIDTDLANLNQLEERIEVLIRKAKSERQSTTRVQAYADSKRKELRQLDQEIGIYASTVSDQTVHDLSEEEFRTLEIHNKKYQRLMMQITTLGEKAIERKHLERNIEGLLKEIGELRLSPEQGPKIGKQIKIYEAEIRRIRKVILQSDDIARDILSKEREAAQFADAHHRYELMARSKHLVSRNDVKNLMLLLTKAKKKRLSVETELGQLDEKLARQKAIEVREEALIQQLKELGKRADDLQARRETLVRMRNSGTTTVKKTGHDGVGSSVREYMDQVVTVWQQFIEHQLREAIEKKMDKISGWPGWMQSLIRQCCDGLTSVGNKGPIKVWSSSEMAAMALGLRLIWMDQSRISFVFFDDDWHWLRKDWSRTEIMTLLKRMDVQQVLHLQQRA